MKYRKVLLALLALAVIAPLTGCGSTPDAGEIGVVRNGKAVLNPFDWFDNHNIRGIVQNGSGYTWVGFGSNVHYYPVNTQQRFFRMESCFEQDGGEVPCNGADDVAITVPTSDGVEVTLNGTIYLNTVFGDETADPSNKECPEGLGGGKGDCLLKKFDQQFATRTFDGKHAYDGTEGWEHFLAAIVQPVIVNNMRQVVGGVECADLVSSCALVQNNGGINGKNVSDALTGKNNQNKVQRVQDAVNTGLTGDLESTLGGAYFKNVQFRLGKVLLPDKVDDAVKRAQAAFADISQAQAIKARAEQEAQANVERQKGYERCPACAQIDTLRAIPKNVTTFAPGANFSVTPGGK